MSKQLRGDQAAQRIADEKNLVRAQVVERQKSLPGATRLQQFLTQHAGQQSAGLIRGEQNVAARSDGLSAECR